LEEIVITKDQVQHSSGRLAVRVSLTCAWCARQVDNIEGQRERTSGRMLLVEQPSFRLLGGRPVCAECGGPLFIEDWRPARATPRLTAADFEDEPVPPARVKRAA
jgi:hypothetical protein